MKKMDSWYFSVLDADDDSVDALIKMNPEKAKAIAYAKKIGGVIKTKYHSEDEGYEYIVYK